MRHQDLTINHRLESFVYANAAARTGATGFVSGDVGRIAYQTDTGQYWRLIDPTPTWGLIVTIPVSSVFGRVGAVVAATNDYTYAQIGSKPVYASLQTVGLPNPAGTGVTTGVMEGFGVGTLPAAARITPSATGKVFVTWSGDVYHVTANINVIISPYYGTGTAPAVNAAVTGTSMGPSIQKASTWTAATRVPFAVSGLISGLILGVPIWLDLSLLTPGTAGGAVENVSCTAIELP